MKVRDGMTTVVLTVGPSHTLREASRMMSARRVGAAVVIDPAHSGIGILTERDILDSLGAGQNPDTEMVGQHRTDHQVPVVYPRQACRQRFEQLGKHPLAVVRKNSNRQAHRLGHPFPLNARSPYDPQARPGRGARTPMVSAACWYGSQEQEDRSCGSRGSLRAWPALRQSEAACGSTARWHWSPEDRPASARRLRVLSPRLAPAR